MAYFNSISARSDFAKPPTYYKKIGKPNAQTGLPSRAPPDLKQLNKGDTDYYLVYHGFEECKIPLKWKNDFPFYIAWLPELDKYHQDPANRQSLEPYQPFKNLSEKYTKPFLDQHSVEIDSNFLKEIRIDGCATFASEVIVIDPTTKLDV